jgi:outer membrane protein TolC
MLRSKNLKRYFPALLSILFSVSLLAQDRLTLTRAVERALENNPDLAVDAPAQEAARLEFRAAKAGYLPRLTFEQSYLGGNNPVFVFGTLLTQRKFTEKNFELSALNSPDPVGNLQTRATVQQTIWDFGRTGSQRKQADLGMKMAELSHEDHRRRIMLDVFGGYHAVSLAQSALETAQLAVRSAEAIENQAKARVENGLAVEADLLRSRVYLSQARQQEIQARGQLETAKAHLNRLMGDPLNSLIGETMPLEPREISVPPETDLLMEQKQRRPDFQNLLTEQRAAEAAVGSRKNELLPVIAGYGTWEMDNPSFTKYGGNNWAAGITFSWDIYAGGGDTARRDAELQRLEQKRRQVAAMESAMALEIRSALIQYSAAEQQVVAAQAAEVQSEEGLRILKNRYDAGLATMTDLLSAETARSSARTRLAQALYQQRISYAQVEYAAGILSPTSEAMNLQ